VIVSPHFSYQDTGKRIKERRKKLHLTQEALAELADISASFVGAIERGEKKMSVETFCKLAERLEISSEFLLFGRWENCRREKCTICAELRRVLSTLE